MPPRRKSQKPKKPKKPKSHPKHCWNCGQTLPDEAVAAKAANVGIAFCCECGTQLGAAGQCRNTVCRFFKKIPQC